MISIIIPIYNAEKTLQDCLESVKNQTYKQIEVILIDDGSIDRSLQICKQYCDLDNRFKFYSHTNKGVSYCRNLGIKVSTGEYIQFVDSDDLLDNEMTEKLYQQIIKDKSDLVICGYKEFLDNSLKKNVGVREDKVLNFAEFLKDFPNLYLDQLLNVPWNKLYVKDKINSTFDEQISLGEDLLFNLEYFSGISKISLIKSFLYRYLNFSNNESLSSRFSINRIEEIKYLNKSLDNFFEKNEISKFENQKKIDIVFFDEVYEYQKQISLLRNLKFKEKKMKLQEVNKDNYVLNKIDNLILSNKRHEFLRKKITKNQILSIILFFRVDKFFKKIS